MTAKNFDHLRAIDHISFDAGGVLVYLDDVRMAALLTEFCGRHVTPAECMHAERNVMRSLSSYKPQLRGQLPQTAYDYFGGMAAYVLGRNPEIVPGYEAFVARCHDVNVNGMLFSKIGSDATEALTRLKAHGFRLSVTSDASGQVERNFRTQGLDSYFEFVLDSGVVGRGKPELYADLVERAGRPAGRILHVDNNRNLVAEALRYGLRSMLFDPQDICEPPPSGALRFRNLLDMADMLIGRNT